MRILVGVLVGCAWTAMVRDAGAICREVGEPGEPPPTLEPDQSVLIVKRDNVVIGEDCDQVVSPDAGAVDAGSVPDAGALDAGGTGVPGTPDAGVVCEEIRGPAIRMVVQPKFRTGPDGARFALLMVTPSDPYIALEEQGLFEQLAWTTRRRTVVEDICIETTSLGYQCKDPQWPSVTGSCASPPRSPRRPSGGGGGGGGCGGGGGGSGDDDDDWWPPEDASPGGDGGPSIQTIGAYDVVEIRTTSLSQLEFWLTDLGYSYGQDDLDALAPYAATGWTVIAVRISIDSSFEGGLEPLSFTYLGSEIRLPLGVSKQPPPAEAHLAVYVAAEGRYDVPGATQPYARWTGVGGGAFLTRNDLWADLSRDADDDPVAARIPADTEQSNTVTVTREIRIPSSDCPSPADPPPSEGGCGGGNDDDDDDDGDNGGRDDGDDGDSHESWCGCRAADFPTPGGALLIVFVAAVLLRRRRSGILVRRGDVGRGGRD